MSEDYEIQKFFVHYFNNLETDFYEKDIIESDSIIIDENKNHLNTSKNQIALQSEISYDEVIQLDDEKSDNERSYINKSTIKNKKEINDLKGNKNKNLNIQLGSLKEKSILEAKYTLVICIAMYSESFDLIDKTLSGIAENLEDLKNAEYNDDKILILIIQDGREKINDEVLQKFTEGRLNNKEDEIDRNMREIFKFNSNKNENSNLINDKTLDLRSSNNAKSRSISNKNLEVKEISNNINDKNKDFDKDRSINNKQSILYTNKNNIDNLNNKNATALNVNNSNLIKKSLPPKNYLISCYLKKKMTNKYGKNPNITKNMDVLFSIKRHNRGKLDSHYWLFMGFCKKINPSYVILLDTGTIPEPGSTLANLIKPMDNYEDIAGTCGEMELSNSEKCTNFILSAQFLEYKYAHVVDKHFESLFGFVSVLPGAFSAYRWECLNKYETSLKEYFKTIDEGNSSCEIANRYLAEDRIFCFILFSMPNAGYILKYIPDSIAKTDAPEIYGEFLLQRRRWINGSNFAMYHNLGIFSNIFKTQHRYRLIFIFFLFLWYALTALFTYFILGTFYFAYYMIVMQLGDNKMQLKDGTYISKQNFGTSLTMAIYFFVILFGIITSLIIKPIREVQSSGKVIYKRTTIFKILTFILGLYNILAFILAIYVIFRGTNTSNATNTNLNQEGYSGAIFLFIVGVSTFILPLLYEPSMIICWHKNYIQYLFLQPTYSIILSIFSVCNIDDVSWGNRDSTHHHSNDEFKLYKIRFLFIWLILNFLQGWGFSYVVVETQYDRALINTYSYMIAFMALFKLLCALCGKIKYVFYDKAKKKILNTPLERVEELSKKVKAINPQVASCIDNNMNTKTLGQMNKFSDKNIQNDNIKDQKEVMNEEKKNDIEEFGSNKTRKNRVNDGAKTFNEIIDEKDLKASKNMKNQSKKIIDNEIIDCFEEVEIDKKNINSINSKKKGIKNNVNEVIEEEKNE